jgi:hypothetical protein
MQRNTLPRRNQISFRLIWASFEVLGGKIRTAPYNETQIFPAASVRDKNSEQPCLKGVCGVHDNRVHWLRMKNITLSADEQLIEQARLLAKSQHKTLNAMFREWLEQFTAQSGGTKEFDALMKRLKHVQAGRRFSREEMNER